MYDDRTQARCDAVLEDSDDVAPIARRRHAGAAEFEHDPRLVMVEHRSRRALRMPLGIPAVWLPRGSIVFENVAQLFFQLSLGEHVLDTTPRRFAALAHGGGFGPPLRSLEQRVEVMGFFGFAKK